MGVNRSPGISRKHGRWSIRGDGWLEVGGLLLLVTLMVLLCAPLNVSAGPPAQEPVPEMWEAEPTSALARVEIATVEPRRFANTTGATLSISGSGFITTTVARLIGYGLLDTTYVSANWLKAQAPAEIPAGRYELEVFNDALVSNRFAIEVTAPAPPATPPSPPPAGRPILTVRSSSVEPSRVRAGQEFVVTIGIYNNGSRAAENTLAVFTGGSFLPVGENGHALWQLHINHTVVVSQTMRAPASVSPGVHQLNIALSANDFSGDHYEYPTTIPVEIVGTTEAVPVTGKPRIVIEAASTSPAEVVPGEPFTLTLRLANRGSVSAVNLFAISSSEELAIPATGSDTVAVERIGANSVLTVTMGLVLGDVERGGRHNLRIGLEYSDHTGAVHSEQQNVGLDVDTSLANRPQLLIQRYHTAPEHLLPGEAFTLTVSIANVGGGEARRVTLSLGGSQGEALDPFIAAGAGNVLFVAEVEQGEVVSVAQRLVVDGSATPKAYYLPVEVAYDDGRGARHSDVQRMSLVIRRRVDLEPRFYRQPDALIAGQPTALEMEIGNLGRSAVSVVEIKAQSAQMEVRLTGQPFTGPLDANGAAPLDLMVTPDAAGPAELEISVLYRDEFNQIETRSWTLRFEVQDAPALPVVPGDGVPQAPAAAEPGSVWGLLLRIVRGLLGLGS